MTGGFTESVARKVHFAQLNPLSRRAVASVAPQQHGTLAHQDKIELMLRAAKCAPKEMRLVLEPAEGSVSDWLAVKSIAIDDPHAGTVQYAYVDLSGSHWESPGVTALLDAVRRNEERPISVYDVSGGQYHVAHAVSGAVLGKGSTRSEAALRAFVASHERQKSRRDPESNAGEVLDKLVDRKEMQSQ